MAIRLGDSGEKEKARVVWRAPQVTVGYASPVVVDGYAYFVNRIGGVQCVDVETGEVQWRRRLPGQSWASPLAHQGHVVFFTKDGTVVSMKSGPDIAEVGESTISATDVVYGVAAVNGSWIIRTGRGMVRVCGEAE